MKVGSWPTKKVRKEARRPSAQQKHSTLSLDWMLDVRIDGRGSFGKKLSYLKKCLERTAAASPE